jgi:hypothetical protein
MLIADFQGKHGP